MIAESVRPVARATALAVWLSRAAAVVRRIIGVPDYSVYVAHLQACHPERAPMTEQEFSTARLAARYEQPGARCC